MYDNRVLDESAIAGALRAGAPILLSETTRDAGKPRT